MSTRLLAILKKEFTQMLRDRMTLFIMIAMPFFQLLIYGYAIDTDVKHLSAVVYDQSLSADSREFLDSLTATNYYDIAYVATSYNEVEERIQKGEAKVGVIIPATYASALKHNHPTEVQVIVDATDPTSAMSAISTAQLVGQNKSQQIMVKKLYQSGISTVKNATAIDIRIRPWYNPDFVTAFYMVPGISGTILTLTMLIFTSLSIVREREQGTLEQLIVTPLKSSELMLGKILPYVLVGYIQLTILVLTGVIVFQVPVGGSILLLYALTSLFIMATLGLGLFVSNMAKNQMQGMMMAAFILLPSIMLSGFVFPRESMPKFFYYLGGLFPLTFYLQIIRGILLKGVTIGYLWKPVLALSLFSAVILTMSVMRFKKRLE
jgi:ABC-2 type transport system permease protein